MSPHEQPKAQRQRTQLAKTRPSLSTVPTLLGSSVGKAAYICSAMDADQLKAQWREEARNAVARALAEGEKRGREGARAEYQLKEASLRGRLKELEEAAGATDAVADAVKKVATKRAKMYLSEVFNKASAVLVAAAAAGGADDDGQIQVSELRTVLVAEVETLTSLFHEAIDATVKGTRASGVTVPSPTCATVGVQTDEDGRPVASSEAQGGAPMHGMAATDVTFPALPGFPVPVGATAKYRPSVVSARGASVVVWPEVASAEQVGTGAFAYVAYKVHTRVAPPVSLDAPSLVPRGRRSHAVADVHGHLTVMQPRRYSEFASLYDALSKHGLPTLAMVPALPPKQAAKAHRHFSDTFVHERRRQLGLWLQHVTGHPTLLHASCLAVFCAGNAATVPKPWRWALDNAKREDHISLARAAWGAQAAEQHAGGGMGAAMGAMAAESSALGLGHRLAESELRLAHAEANALAPPLEGCLEHAKRLRQAVEEAAAASGALAAALHPQAASRVDGGEAGFKGSWDSGLEDALLEATGEACGASAATGSAVAGAALRSLVEPLRFHAR